MAIRKSLSHLTTCLNNKKIDYEKDFLMVKRIG